MSGTLEPATLEETIARGDTYTLVFEVFEGLTEATAVPVDVSGRTYRATARHPVTDMVLKELATGSGISVSTGVDGEPNRLTLTFPLADTAGFPVDAVKWDLEETIGTNRQTLILAVTNVKEDQSR